MYLKKKQQRLLLSVTW